MSRVQASSNSVHAVVSHVLIFLCESYEWGGSRPLCSVCLGGDAMSSGKRPLQEHGIFLHSLGGAYFPAPAVHDTMHTAIYTCCRIFLSVSFTKARVRVTLGRCVTACGVSRQSPMRVCTAFTITL